MGITATGIDARKYLIGWLEQVSVMYGKDIRATPDAKWTETHGGCTRPANALLADAVTMLNWTTQAVKGEEATAYNEMGALTEKMVDREVAASLLEDATKALSTAIAEASDEKLNSEVMAPWQMPTPLFSLAHIAVSHIWYHDGQLNYIQTLCGDEKVHWMGE